MMMTELNISTSLAIDDLGVISGTDTNDPHAMGQKSWSHLFWSWYTDGCPLAVGHLVSMADWTPIVARRLHVFDEDWNRNMVKLESIIMKSRARKHYACHCWCVCI